MRTKVHLARLVANLLGSGRWRVARGRESGRLRAAHSGVAECKGLGRNLERLKRDLERLKRWGSCGGCPFRRDHAKQRARSRPRYCTGPRRSRPSSSAQRISRGAPHSASRTASGLHVGGLVSALVPVRRRSPSILGREMPADRGPAQAACDPSPLGSGFLRFPGARLATPEGVRTVLERYAVY
jgi:hypothetical protein